MELEIGAINKVVAVRTKGGFNDPAQYDYEYKLVSNSIASYENPWKYGPSEPLQGDYVLRLDLSPMTIPGWNPLTLIGITGNAEVLKDGELFAQGMVGPGYQIMRNISGLIEWGGSPVGGGSFGLSPTLTSAGFSIDL